MGPSLGRNLGNQPEYVIVPQALTSRPAFRTVFRTRNNDETDPESGPSNLLQRNFI